MSVQSNPPNEDYSRLFVVRGPQVGPLCDLVLSPNGMRLLLLTEHSVTVVDTRIGYIQTFLNTGPTSQLTAATWLSDTRCMLGCVDGHLFQARFQPAAIFGSPSVTVWYAFQDLNLPVRFLRYDRTRKHLAIGYESGVSIWRSTPTTWRIVDRFEVPTRPGITGVETMQFIGAANQLLFVSGKFGHAFWIGRGDVGFHLTETPDYSVRSSAVSADGETLVLGMLDRSVHVMSITAEVPRGPIGSYLLESGGEYHNLSPYIPLAVTDSGLVVAGSQVGEISFARRDGTHVSSMYFERNLSVTGLLSHGERLYAAFSGPFGCIIIVAYSRANGAKQMFERLRKAFAPGGAHSVVNLDIHHLPRTSLRNLPRKTGRTNFKMTYPGQKYDYFTPGLYIIVSLVVTQILIHLIRHHELYLASLVYYYNAVFQLYPGDVYHTAIQRLDRLVQLFYEYFTVRILNWIMSFGASIHGWILLGLVKVMVYLTKLIIIINELGAN